MTISREVRMRAFAMYCQQLPAKEIAIALSLRGDYTVYKWMKKEDWPEKRDEISKLINEKARKGSRESQILVADAIVGLFLERIENDKTGTAMEIKARDAIEAMKFKRLIEGESTENIAVAVRDVTEKQLDDSYEKFQKEFKQGIKNRKSITND